MKILTLDVETHDSLLLTHGMGWAFKYNFPEMPFEVLGFGFKDSYGYTGYIDLFSKRGNADALLHLIKSHDAILCHNALYDIGALIYLFRDKLDLNRLILLDTVLMAKLHNQHLLSYSLDSLTEHYKVVERKQSDILHDYAWTTGMYQKEHMEKTGRNCNTRPSAAILNRWCMSDMRRFPVEVVAEYCLQDVKATYALYEELAPKVAYLDLTKYSDILKVCLDVKKRGTRIDLNRAAELEKQFDETAKEAEDIVHITLGWPEDLNINSTKQLGEALLADGFQLPLTDKGSPSLKSEWLEDQEHEIFKNIKRYRKALKVKKDFVQKLIKYQEVIPEKYKQNGKGWLFPSLKPLGATMTGRFTSGGGSGSLELSIHQIPRRDEEFGAPVRELFIAHENEQLVCCDFSSQESRLQVHYAKLLNCKGVQPIVDAWITDPSMKYHNKVAELTDLDYETAKMINLGLSYGMHTKKLSEKIGVSEEEGERIIKQYHRLLPFMQQLQGITARNILKLGYIKTIGGRKLYIDPPYKWMGKTRTNESKGLSKLIQGSASDQCIQSMIDAHKAGLHLLFSVHDEIAISSLNAIRDEVILRECMENSYPLAIPMVAESGIGLSWKEAK